MRREVARRYEFHASHEAEGMPAPWSERHEHDYTVEVVARGEGPVVVDTDVLDAAWDVIAALFAGRHLNDTVGGPTTVEHLSGYLLDHFRGAAPAVARVTVWEDDSRWGSAAR